MVRSEAFFRYVSDEPMPQLLVYGLFLLVVFYALRCGLEGIVRVLGLAAGLFLLSMALMLVSNLGGMHLSNLTFQPFDFPEVLRTAARGFTLPPELPLFCLLSLHANREKRRPLLKTLALLCVFYIGLTFCSEAVLGMKAQLQQQTIHTLSRLGSISVFRRLDALHIAAWERRLQRICARRRTGNPHGGTDHAVCCGNACAQCVRDRFGTAAGSADDFGAVVWLFGRAA